MVWYFIRWIKEDSGDTEPKGDTGKCSDEEAGWKLPIDKIQTTKTLLTGVSAGYRVTICTSFVMLIKEYNETSGETESLNQYSAIPLKHSGSMQRYLAKSIWPVYLKCTRIPRLLKVRMNCTK